AQGPSGARRLRALKAYQTALRLDPDNWRILTGYGEALLPWRVIQDSNPQVSEALLLRRAIWALERALRAAPSAARPHLALYWAYLARGADERAAEQLRQVWRKNYFPQACVDFAYDLLVSVDPGGYLITGGDLDTYPALMLQVAQGLRTDVTVVNVSMFNAPWYALYLARQRGLPLSLDSSALVRLRPRFVRRWQRVVPPSLQVLADAVSSPGRSRGSFYFSITVDRAVLAGFKPLLSLEGFVYRLGARQQDIPVNRRICSSNLLSRYRIPEFDSRPLGRSSRARGLPSVGYESLDCRSLAVDCGAAFLALADEMASLGDTVQAIELCQRAAGFLIWAGRKRGLDFLVRYWLRLAPADKSALELLRSHLSR
ncbi:MAG: hypothetical protein ABIK62_00525, partial [candidate division WOR-3 bacterium]